MGAVETGNVFDSFKRRKDYLICVDSDGCAMDTMDIKHIRCFGPCMVEEWELEPWRTPILTRWNEINLYSMTRGINRFKGLALALSEIDRTCRKIDGIRELSEWADTAPELSNGALERICAGDGRPVVFAKALHWSERVNESIDRLPDEEKKPFEGVKKGLEAAQEAADVAVVSSANQQAVIEEWSRYGLLKYTDIVLTQNEGSKAYCIGRMAGFGYEKDHILMLGDAPGDRDAAEKNGVPFYPILVQSEKTSWERFEAEALGKFTGGSFRGEYEMRLKAEFEENLS